jgi:AraC-like DNA-binding protein
MGLAQSGPRWAQTDHAHANCSEVHLVRRGGGMVRHKGRLFKTVTGDVYLFRPAEPHGGETSFDDPAQIFYMAVEIPPALLDSVFAPLGGSPIYPEESATELRAALQALSDELVMLGSERGEHTVVKALSPSLLAKSLHVLGALLEPARQPRVVSGTARERELAEELLRKVEASKLTQITLQRMASDLDVTPAYLGAALRSATGKTFPELVADVRVRRARQLLSDPGIPIREVARRVGLASPRALGKLFRRITGRTPASFR